MAKIKLFNDPVYGLISFPFEVIYELIDHPYFQRLRRISQMGLAHMVYPGATHTRFHHAIGVVHLCTLAIDQLRAKNIEISDEEYEAVCIAGLLHDIGHGPYSHALEFMLIPMHHEVLTLRIMDLLNKEFDGKLDLAIKIFTNAYPRIFFHQLLSGQLDIDRMDYLNRDSFYTGVAEGVIGYDRILRMINVADGRLVIEQKGIYSVEKFLFSRYLMYRQVYLHKTAVGAERLLQLFISELKKDPHDLSYFGLIGQLLANAQTIDSHELTDSFLVLDDSDVIYALKMASVRHNDLLSDTAKCLLNRQLPRVVVTEKWQKNELNVKKQKNPPQSVTSRSPDSHKSCTLHKELVVMYQKTNEIEILTKPENKILPFSSFNSANNLLGSIELSFSVYPRKSQ